MTTPVLNKTNILPQGYTMRPTRLEDAEAVAYVFTETSRQRGDCEITPAENILEDWQEPGFDLSGSCRVVTDHTGRVVASATVFDNFSKPVHPFVSWEVLPVPERHEIALALLAWCENRTKDVLERCPPEARISWKTAILAGYAPDEAIMAETGMQVVRYFSRMLVNLEAMPDAPVLPAGISIQTYRHPDDLERVVSAKDEAWHDHFGYLERPLEELVKDWRYTIEKDRLFDESLWHMAIDDASGEIAGLVLSRIEDWEDPAAGYVDIVSTRPAWRGRGIAGNMLRHAFRELWQRGKKSIALHVDDSSPTGANRLYESVGMHTQRQYAQYEKELRQGIELTNKGKSITQRSRDTA